MYLYDDLFADKKIYFAGGECFYPKSWPKIKAAEKAYAEANGISTSRPGDKDVDLKGITDPHERADTIFRDLVERMKETDIIIANLEMFRGTEPDGGTVFEIGMAYAKGCKCYGFTRDKRKMLLKNQDASLNPEDGKVYDSTGRILPMRNHTFNSMITGSCKIIEGDYTDAVKALLLDLEDDAKKEGAVDYKPEAHEEVKIPQGKPIAYLAGPWVFEPGGKEIGERRRALAEKYGIEVIFPAPEGPPRPKHKNPWTFQYNVFDIHMKELQNSNVIIADLNNFGGFEPDSGTAFECGAAYWYGHKMYGFKDSTAPMIEQIPNVKAEDGKYYAYDGSSVENSDYPMNLMFSSSMNILEGKFEDIIKQVAIDLGTYTE